MKEYIRSVKVTAEQFKLTDEQKATVGKKPSNPANVWGGDLKKRKDDEADVYFATIPIDNEKRVVEENDWLVKEGDKSYIVTDQDFKKSFTPVTEDVEEKEDAETGPIAD